MPETPRKPDPPYDPDAEPTGRYPISRLRKFFLLAFVIGFWVFYFWYNTGKDREQTAPAPLAPVESTQDANGTSDAQ